MSTKAIKSPEDIHTTLHRHGLDIASRLTVHFEYIHFFTKTLADLDRRFATNEIFNPKHDQQKELMKLELVKASTKYNDRYQGTWNRPVQSWSVTMKLILNNQKTIDINVSKIANDKSPDMTHLYFGSKHCSDPLPNCSEKLGNFLEELTSYSGVNW